MKKQTIFIKVEQSLKEFQSNTTEKWHHETSAERIELKSYQIITYQDAQNRWVKVKVYSDQKRMEISYENNKMYFNIANQTEISYKTPQGALMMNLNTHELIIGANEWLVSYELILENKPLGHYQFRLIYRP